MRLCHISSYLFECTVALSHSIIRMYAVAIWAPFVFRCPYLLPYQLPPVLQAMAGNSDDLSGEYTPSNEDVAEGMRRWEMPPEQHPLVFHWLKVQERQKYHYHQLGRWPLPPRAGGISYRVCLQRVPGRRCHLLEGMPRPSPKQVVVVLLSLLQGAGRAEVVCNCTVFSVHVAGPSGCMPLPVDP